MIHLNIGSNLNSKYGSRFDNISIAINLLANFPKFLNVGLTIDYKDNYIKLFELIKKIEKN